MIGKLNHEQIDQVLNENVLGRIGCNDGFRTYVVPVNYVYDGKHIIGHSVPGMKIQMMRNNPDVCFEVDDMKSFTRWKSVIAWGRYQEIADERERYYALKLFVDKMMHIKVSSTAMIPGGPTMPHDPHADTHAHIKPVVYRIILTEKTGRFEND